MRSGILAEWNSKKGILKMNKRILVVCTTDSMIWNFLVPHIRELEKQGFYVECASSITGDFYSNLVKLHGIKMNEIPFVRSPYHVRNLHAFKALYKLIKEKQFDTIYCHEPVGAAMGRIAGHLCNCKIIYIAHGFHFYKGAPKKYWLLYYPVEKWLARYTDALITINREDYELAKSRMKLRNGAKVYYVPGVGIDLEKFSKSTAEKYAKRSELGIPEEAILLLSVGELNSNKNHAAAIRAVADLDVYYIIAGMGELQSDLQNLIDELGIGNRVKLLGYRSDVKELYEAADIFVFPSFREGLSVAVMEAMASGLPCVVSRIRGNTDLVEDGSGGFHCSPNDPSEFAEKISILSADVALREKMGQHNLSVIHKFSSETVIQQLSSIYHAEFIT